MTDEELGANGGHGFIRPCAETETESEWVPIGTGGSGWDTERECGWTNVVEYNPNSGEYRNATVYATDKQ